MKPRNYVKKYMDTVHKPSIIPSARDKKLGSTLAKEMGEEALQSLTGASSEAVELNINEEEE